MRRGPAILAGIACLLLLPGAWAQTDDRGYQWDVADDVPESELAVVRSGLSLMGNYLDAHAGGDVPANQRAQIVVKVVATGQGNQENGGGGSCCTAFSEGVSRPFFDVRHPHWVNVGGLGGAEHHVAHEAAHTWFASLGCISHHDQSLGMWLNEGMAEQMAYEALIDDGQMTAQQVFDSILATAKGDGQWTYPLVDLSNPTAPVWPGHIGYLALHFALDGRDVELLRDFCVQYASGATREAVFQAVFGVPLDTFYDRFESWKQTQSAFGVQWDVGPGVTEAELQPIRSGLVLGEEFLQGHVGGGVPLADRTGLVVRVVASGDGHEGACCTAGLGGNIVPGEDLALFIDVRHPHWTNRAFSHDGHVERTTIAGQLQTTIHEYTHVWQANLGCNQNLPKWAVEGMAEQTSYEAIVGAGQMSHDIVYPFVLSIAQDQEWTQPLPSYSTDAPAWPGDIGWLAFERARGGAGQATFRTLCEMAGEGRSVEEAFQAAFGQGLDSFYTDFQAWKDTNPQVVWPSRSEQNSPSPVTSPAESTSDPSLPDVGAAAGEAPPPESGQPGSRGIPMPLVTMMAAIGFAAGSRRRL